MAVWVFVVFAPIYYRNIPPSLLGECDRDSVAINDHHDSRFVIKLFLVDLAATRNLLWNSRVAAEGVCVSNVLMKKTRQSAAALIKRITRKEEESELHLCNNLFNQPTKSKCSFEKESNYNHATFLLTPSEVCTGHEGHSLENSSLQWVSLKSHLHLIEKPNWFIIRRFRCIESQDLKRTLKFIHPIRLLLVIPLASISGLQRHPTHIVIMCVAFPDHTLQQQSHFISHNISFVPKRSWTEEEEEELNSQWPKLLLSSHVTFVFYFCCWVSRKYLFRKSKNTWTEKFQWAMSDLSPRV